MEFLVRFPIHILAGAAAQNAAEVRERMKYPFGLISAKSFIWQSIHLMTAKIKENYRSIFIYQDTISALNMMADIILNPLNDGEAKKSLKRQDAMMQLKMNIVKGII
jgi:hypothetical protein